MLPFYATANEAFVIVDDFNDSKIDTFAVNTDRQARRCFNQSFASMFAASVISTILVNSFAIAVVRVLVLLVVALFSEVLRLVAYIIRKVFFVAVFDAAMDDCETRCIDS